MATAKKKTAPKKQATKKPAPKPHSMPAKVVKPKPEATQTVTEPKSSKKSRIQALLLEPAGIAEHFRDQGVNLSRKLLETKEP